MQPTTNTSKKAPRLVRERELCGNPHAVPPVPRMLPFSRATLWRKVKEGDFPQPIRISAGITAWRLDEIETWLAGKPVGASEPDRLRAAPRRVEHRACLRLYAQFEHAAIAGNDAGHDDESTAARVAAHQ